MSSFKDGLRRSGQSVLDARAQNLYEMTKDETTSQFNDELLSGDWEEQFNSIRTSYYDKLTV